MVDERSSPSTGWDEIQKKMSGETDSENSSQDTSLEEQYRFEISAREDMPDEFVEKLNRFNNYFETVVDQARRNLDQEGASAKARISRGLKRFYEEEGVYAVFQDTGDRIKPVFLGIEDEDFGKAAWKDEEYFQDTHGDDQTGEEVVNPTVTLVEDYGLEDLGGFFLEAWKMPDPDYISEELSTDSLPEKSPYESGIFAPTDGERYSSLQDL